MTRTDAAPASPAGATSQTTAGLEREARVLARYLLGRDCPSEMVERYVAGGRALAAANASDARTADFALAHPRLLPFIDAAAAVTGRGALLRAKTQLMAAILEASPLYAAEFLDAPRTPSAALCQIAAASFIAAVEMAIGIPLLFALHRRKS